MVSRMDFDCGRQFTRSAGRGQGRPAHWLRKLAAGTAVFLAGTTAALAGCADAPQPGVDWRKCIMHSRAFPGVDLTGAQLRDGRFTRANFADSVMESSDLRRAKFIDADMRGVKFDGARLSGADLTRANLAGASMRDANLTRTQMQKANLRGVDLTGAMLNDTVLTEADLSGATWIDGKTVCAEGSISYCQRRPTGANGSG